MADIAGVTSANIAASVRTVRELSGSSRTTGTVFNALPNQLRSTDSSHRVVISSDKTQAAIQASVFIGKNIVGMLKGLSNLVEVAATSLTKTTASISVDYGTRISVVNISSDLKRTLARIEELVENTSVGSGNLISSTSRDLTLKTTKYGGEVNISPQPLDLKGLNLENINLHTDEGIQDAIGRINFAITIAEERVRGLELLESALFGSGAISTALKDLGATGQSELRGVLINQFA